MARGAISDDQKLGVGHSCENECLNRHLDVLFVSVLSDRPEQKGIRADTELSSQSSVGGWHESSEVNAVTNEGDFLVRQTKLVQTNLPQCGRVDDCFVNATEQQPPCPGSSCLA